jgi:hypothetical protein
MPEPRHVVCRAGVASLAKHLDEARPKDPKHSEERAEAGALDLGARGEHFLVANPRAGRLVARWQVDIRASDCEFHPSEVSATSGEVRTVATFPLGPVGSV